ncbi:hypothetical protein PABG_11616 [Paracoccidioides brasiliensis Pb03]|nr:hypothetical protein PABG_11616 [Paracoccidioides brasiliensis Pb03]
MVSNDEERLKIFHYRFTTWRNGAPSILQELLDLGSLWKDMGLPGDCPDAPTEQELREHVMQHEGFKTTYKLTDIPADDIPADDVGWMDTK